MSPAEWSKSIHVEDPIETERDLADVLRCGRSAELWAALLSNHSSLLAEKAKKAAAAQAAVEQAAQQLATERVAFEAEKAAFVRRLGLMLHVAGDPARCLTEPGLMLHVVEYHGELWSLNNRRQRPERC